MKKFLKFLIELFSWNDSLIFAEEEATSHQTTSNSEKIFIEDLETLFAHGLF